MQNWKHRWHGLKQFERQFNPRGLVLVAILLVAVAAGYLLSWPQRLTLQQQQENAEVAERLQKERIRVLTESHAALEIELETERRSQADTVAMMAQLRQQLAQAETELTFYRNIMAPEQNADGVVIHEVAVENSHSPGHFRYKLVLTQQKKRKRFAKGQASMLLTGSQDGSPTTLNLERLGVERSQLKFSFRYFQELEGSFDLPEHFVPERLTVKVKTAAGGGQKAASTEQVYEFAVLTQPASDEGSPTSVTDKT
ncbi:DUF6776 family protein [Ferrimonas kyonanensis]|uniref:DUF6776 family protein n=1 Tax=Ferrimonas kyonanensis TaxID=364763 RepID=UPI000422A263|nr:DUF6776 family protein [Ferrimonas kyonanensis]